MKRSYSASNMNSRGFTLVEILVTLAITGIITAGIYNFMISQSRSYNVQEEVQEMQQNARAAMEFLVAELQKTKNIKIGGGGFAVTLTYDVDGDGNLEFPTYTFNLQPNFYSNSEMSAPRISVSPFTVDGIATNDVASGFIASFITQDLDGSGAPDTPLFQYNPAVNSKMVTLTIIARTRNSDPNYALNNGHRQIVLRRRVVLINS